jgi:thermostable 8-oxoguanine DNA glycosylase
MVYYGFKQLRIRRKEYYRMEKAMQMLARQRGMQPAEYQAMIWCKAVTSAGRTPYSYVDAAKGGF